VAFALYWGLMQGTLLMDLDGVPASDD